MSNDDQIVNEVANKLVAVSANIEQIVANARDNLRRSPGRRTEIYLHLLWTLRNNPDITRDSAIDNLTLALILLAEVEQPQPGHH